MRHCPWCEEYIKSYLNDDGILTKEELEEDRKRVENGFWASISQVNDEQYLMNKALGLELPF